VLTAQSWTDAIHANPVALALAPIVIAGLIGLRYLIFAGGALWLVHAFRKPLAGRRIQPVPFTRKQLRREAGYSALSIIVFTLVLGGVFFLNTKHRFLQTYAHIGDYGPVWFAASIPLSILVHDFYFYWAHRCMHLPSVFERVHKVHHLSTNPSPLAAFAFHPIEAVVESLALVIISAIIPIHPLALGLVGLYSIATNVLGHLGYEFFPARFASHPVFGWLNTATSHNQHHRSFRYNYGLYTLIWDRVFGTVHPDYSGLFARTTAQRGEFGAKEIL
jgi:sterol desaturase/sphingolipid hydroxylase (fatty acid hydroxylase superfamily)